MHVGQVRLQQLNITRNRFAALDVEDTDESLDIIASDISTMAAPTKDTSKNQSPAVYEVEVDYKWDFQFAIYCFFEDLHNLQEYLQGTWKRYKAGDIDIISATILTTGALDQVHRAEKEIYAMYPSPLPQGRAYEDLAIIMRCMESICNGKNPLEPFASREFTPFEEYIYLPTANCLMKFAEFHEQVFPSMVPPIGLRYILQPELLESPHMRKLEAEDRVLTQILIDLDLIELMKDDHSEILKTTMPGIDERILPGIDDCFTRAVRSVLTTGLVTVESVFASRLLLDILDICGGHFKGREILLDEASCTQSIFQFKKKTRVFAGEGYQWFSGDENLFMKVCQLLNVHIGSPIEAISKKSMFRHFREAFESRESGSEELDPVLLEAYPERPPQNLIENAKKFNIRIIRPNKDLHFRTNHNPLYVGSLLFNLTALTEDAGVAFANQQLFIFEIAHLYNAVRQLDLSGIRWPKMERIIDMHVRAFFAGEVPVTPDAMLKRLNFRMGQSCERTFFKKKAWKIQPSPATQALNQLFEKKEVADLTLQQLKEHVQKRHNQCSQRKPKQSRQHPLTPREFIDQLETYLGVVLPDIRTDYVTLTRACNIVLRRVRLRLELQLGVKVPSMQIPGVANDLGLMDMVLWILEETSEEWELHRRVTRDRDREPFRGGPMLRVVAEVIDEFLEANCEELG